MKPLVWDARVAHAIAKAKRAGLHQCECGFKYYKTVNLCPKCNKPINLLNIEWSIE